MSMIVNISINGGPPIELIEVRRIIDTRELTQKGLDPEITGDLQYYEVTRFTRNAEGKIEQWREPTHVHHDPDDGAARLAYVAIESVVDGETRDDAWLDAKREADDEIMEVVDTKDGFIGMQSEIIQACMHVFSEQGVWNKVPDDLVEALRDYV